MELVFYRAEDAALMVAAAKRAVTISVLVKVSANWPDLLEAVEACLQAGADGITAIDSSCVTVCAYNACRMTPQGEMLLDENLYRSCGLCTSVCPTGALCAASGIKRVAVGADCRNVQAAARATPHPAQLFPSGAARPARTQSSGGRIPQRDAEPGL